VFALSTVGAVFYRFTEERLGLLWRGWLTRHLIGRYLSGHAYYRLNSRADVDNPDQRIAEDVRNFTTTTLSLVLILLNSGVRLFLFSGVLWSITPQLFLTAVIYAGVGTLLTVLVGHRLVGLNIGQFRKEADFRHELIRVRDQAEPIALLKGEGDEDRRLWHRLQAVLENLKRIIAVNRNLGFFTTGYNYLIQLIPILVVAPLYIRGEIEFGEVTQSAMTFNNVIAAFSLVVVEFARISSFAAVVERVGALGEAVEEKPAGPVPAIEVVEDGPRLAYEGLTLLTPKDARPLIKSLSLEIPAGGRLLITGPNGSGRSALQRATAGLWRRGEGRIVRPALERVIFLPQQPYLVPGTLRDQLLYGGREEGITDEAILAVLRQVRFDPVLERVGGLEAGGNWPEVLSLGEQQLLAFARLLLARPRFAFLDEATSALQPGLGRQLYEVLSRTSVTYVSVGTDPGLLEYHDMLLEISQGGTWRVTPRSPAAGYSRGDGRRAQGHRDVSRQEANGLPVSSPPGSARV
jgi:putative ATP-binding cassette transporter